MHDDKKAQFHETHWCMLLKYSGISFISGAVNHGFFSGSRSLWTAGIGIALFLCASIWERSLKGEAASEGLAASIAWGAALSIGLGFFTGGLQHFPDSPSRSAWVVPLGLAISAAALWASEIGPGGAWRKAAIASGAAVMACAAASYSAAGWLASNPQWLGAATHDHGTQGPQLLAVSPARSLRVELLDSMAFAPKDIRVSEGESVLFEVSNPGAALHEFVVGTPEEIAEHAKLMKAIASGSAPAHAHGQGAALSLEPGRSGRIAISFPKAGVYEIACLAPGHYEAGMRGTITVEAREAAFASNPHANHTQH